MAPVGEGGASQQCFQNLQAGKTCMGWGRGGVEVHREGNAIGRWGGQEGISGDPVGYPAWGPVT